MTGAIPHDEQLLARATKMAIRAAGGLEACAAATGLSTSQLSRCCSPWQRDSISVRDALAIEAIGHGEHGHPYILRTLARELGFTVVAVPDLGEDGEGLMLSVAQLARELGDVSGAVVAALADGGVSPVEAQAALDQLNELEAATASLRGKLMALAYPAPFAA